MADVVITAAGALAPVRWWPLDGCLASTARQITVVVRAGAAVSECRLGCSEAGWVQAKCTGVFDWTALPTTTRTGPDLGAFGAGDTKTVLLKIQSPTGMDTRRRLLTLRLGTGT